MEFWADGVQGCGLSGFMGVQGFREFRWFQGV